MKLLTKVMQREDVKETIQELSELEYFYDYEDAKGYLKSILEDLIEESFKKGEADLRKEIVAQERERITELVQNALEGDTK